MSINQNDTKVVMLSANHQGSVCCPDRNEKDVWRVHPRVYLALDKNQQVRCPYCGIVYQVSNQ